MDDDDDVPPMLVAADSGDAAEEALTSEMEDVKITKVPITIITGKFFRKYLHMTPILLGFDRSSSRLNSFFFLLKLAASAHSTDFLSRLPRSRQDHPPKLHSHGPTRQKNRRHPQRVWKYHRH